MTDPTGIAETPNHGVSHEAPASMIPQTNYIGQNQLASSGVAAAAQAHVLAAYQMAFMRPRDHAIVRKRLLDECSRAQFAEAAIYHVPKGKGIEGPSIRFAETAMRAMTNLQVRATTTEDDERKRVIEVVVTDLESNTSFARSVTVTKVVERSTLSRGQKSLGTRINSNGYPVHLVEATDDEVMAKESALISKARRNGIISMLDGGLLAEAMDKLRKVRREGAGRDLKTRINTMVDRFDELGIRIGDLTEFLGHPVADCNQQEVDTLLGVFTALRDDQIAWADVIEERRAEQKAAGKEDSRAPSKEAEQRAADIRAAMDEATDNLQLSRASRGLSTLPAALAEPLQRHFDSRQSELTQAAREAEGADEAPGNDLFGEDD